MGIFYHAPQPAQARTNAPIPPQGDQPPRLRRLDQRLLWSWFALDGRIPQPARSSAWDMPAAVGQVPLPLPPWQIWRAWQQEQARVPRATVVAPLTLLYGDQPPPLSRAALWHWMQQYGYPIWREQSAARSAAWDILVFIPGDAPPPKISAAQWQVISSWFQITWPAQHANTVGPGLAEFKKHRGFLKNVGKLLNA